MLDTDIASYVIRGRPESARARFRELESDQLCLSVVSEAELLYGVRARGSLRALPAMVADFLRHLTILDRSRAAAAHYAELRAKLEEQGTPIGNMDLMIAAHARSEEATLVTNNRKHFVRVPGLKIENWA